MATWLEQGLRARKKGLAKQRKSSRGQEVKLCETGRERLFGTLPKADSAKALELHRNYHLKQKSMQSLNQSSWTHVCHVYGLCTLQNTKNLPGKRCKKLFGTLQKRSHGLQIRLRTPSESKVSVEHPSGSQKDQFFLAGPAMEEAMDTPKWCPRGSRTTQKSMLHGECVLAQFFVGFGPPHKRFSEGNYLIAERSFPCLCPI